jgi:hypothetical protein
MAQSESIGALIGAVAAVMGGFRGVEKSGVNQFHRYKYASDADILWTLKPLLAEHGLAFILVGYVVEAIAEVKTKNGGAERLIDLRVTYRLAHKSGEWMDVTAPGSGQDPGDKAHYKAMTGALKYALRQSFAIPTGDDPEADAQPKRESAAEKQARQSAHHASWSGARAGFCAKLGEMGRDYAALGEWCEANGRPRPSSMDDAGRAKVLAFLASEKGAGVAVKS